jgi:hypothetical protein
VSAIQDKIDIFVLWITEFAKQKHISPRDAYLYLKRFGGVDFLDKNYAIEHTLPLADTMEALTEISKRNGGYLE